jgi:hypothetical protein
MIMSTNTIADPKAVMIVSLNADSTFSAMSRSILTGYFTNRAKVFFRFFICLSLNWLHLIVFFHKLF